MMTRSLRTAMGCAAIALQSVACASTPNATSASASQPSRPLTIVDCSMVAGTLKFAEPVHTRDTRPSLVDSGLSEVVVRLADCAGSPAGGALVMLYTDSVAPSNRFAAYAFSDSLGIAALPAIAAREYLIRVSLVGFKATSTNVLARTGFSDTLRITAVWCGCR